MCFLENNINFTFLINLHILLIGNMLSQKKPFMVQKYAKLQKAQILTAANITYFTVFIQCNTYTVKIAV